MRAFLEITPFLISWATYDACSDIVLSVKKQRDLEFKGLKLIFLANSVYLQGDVKLGRKYLEMAFKIDSLILANQFEAK